MHATVPGVVRMVKDYRNYMLRGRVLFIHALPLAVTLAFSPAEADNPEGVGDHPVATGVARQFQIWIQDPWTGETRLTTVPEPDTELWNQARIEDYEAAVAVEAAPPLGVLSIVRLGLKVPIYNGTDEFNLDRGLGRIPGMARPDEDGNLGISGHRDGFFRVLKDIQEGDRIMIRSTARVETYVVDSITVVDKHDDTLLTPSDEKMLTLVTCYPFYFVGHAPKRWIVRASPVNRPVTDYELAESPQDDTSL